MTDGRTFGQTVREARLAKGMSMGQLAAAVERSTASVRRWERDEGVPTEAVIDELERVLDVEFGDVAPGAELPEIERVPIVTKPPPDATRPTALAGASPTQTGLQVVPRGIFQEIRDPSKPWLGYIRAALTVVVLIVLAWFLIWAAGHLAASVGEIWDSLWADAT